VRIPVLGFSFTESGPTSEQSLYKIVELTKVSTVIEQKDLAVSNLS
jgi:hypothetical protein